MTEKVHDECPVCKHMRGENERLRAALSEAISIAHGSGADFTWQAVERLRNLRAIANR